MRGSTWRGAGLAGLLGLVAALSPAPPAQAALSPAPPAQARGRPVEDASVLLQAAVRMDVDCAAFPPLCLEPFSCRDKGPGWPPGVNGSVLQRLPTASKRASSRVFATADGHANMNSYCGTEEQYAMLECAAGNLTGYAKLKRFGEPKGADPSPPSALRAASTAGRAVLDDFHHDFMAQYCFYLGHCDNEEVHEGMTLAEAEALCDKTFGHESWARFGEGGVLRTRALSVLGGTLKLKLLSTDGLMKLKLGLPSARGMGKIACGQGHYHCDVQNCKENYCSKQKYWKKYHHRLPGK